MAQYARGDDVVEGITPRERVQLEAAGFQLVPEPQEKQPDPDDDTSGDPAPVDADESRRGRGRRRRSGGPSES